MRLEDVLFIVAQNLPVTPDTLSVAVTLNALNRRFRAETWTPPANISRDTACFDAWNNPLIRRWLRDHGHNDTHPCFCTCANHVCFLEPESELARAIESVLDMNLDTPSFAAPYCIVKISTLYALTDKVIESLGSRKGSREFHGSMLCFNDLARENLRQWVQYSKKMCPTLDE